MFTKQTIKNIDLKDKTVLVRADFNVPLDDGRITDDYRIAMCIPTIEALLEQHAKVILISHLGRPKGQVDEKYSLKPVAERLNELLDVPVHFASDCIGEAASSVVQAMNHGEVTLLENVRFHIEEKTNDERFAKEIIEATGAEVFVQNGFGVVHRAHASTDAITKFVPSVAGLLVEAEVRAIERAIRHPNKPLITLVGGAKIASKIELLDNFAQIADKIIIGGAMANTFLVALGYHVGKSLYDADEVEEAHRVLADCKKYNTEIVLPVQDVAVGKTTEDNEPRHEVATDMIAEDDMILDLGASSLRTVLKHLETAGEILWNGPLGMSELENFRHGSETVARFIADKGIECVVGGGDSAALVDQLELADKFTHVSTGGGASLDLMAGKELPGIAALRDHLPAHKALHKELQA